MALRKIADASVEPVTLAEAKAHLNVFETTRDAYITSLITVARTECEELLQRTLLTTTWELSLDAFPDVIELLMPRVIAVSSVKYYDTAGVLQTLSAPLYLVDDRNEPGAIVPAYGLTWPATREQLNAVTVTYTAGYGAAATAVPAPIKQWILLAMGTLFDNRERDVVTPGVVAVELGFADHLLDTYRVWAV